MGTVWLMYGECMENGIDQVGVFIKNDRSHSMKNKPVKDWKIIDTSLRFAQNGARHND
jgi:hypothetical protein